MHHYTALSLMLLAGLAIAGPPSYQDSNAAKLPIGSDEESIRAYDAAECAKMNDQIRKTSTVDLTWKDPNDPKAKATWWNTYVPAAWSMNVDSPTVLYCQASGRHAFFKDENAFNDFAQKVYCPGAGIGTFKAKPNLVMEGGSCVAKDTTVGNDPHQGQETTCGCKYLD